MGQTPEEIPRYAGRAQALRNRPIDLVHLARQSMGDWALECEVLRLFDQMARTYFARVERSGTVEELICHLQSLKGAAAGVGAWGIAELSLRAESELGAGGAVDPERIDDLHMAVEEASAFIEDILRHEPA